MEKSFIFDEVQPFVKDLAAVNLDGKWGVINKSGNWVIKPSYEHLASIDGNLFECEQNNKESIIDKNEKLIIHFEYDSLAFINRHENLIIAQKRDKYGIVNFKGEIIIPFDYDFISSESNNDYLIVQKGNHFGCIDMNNNIILPFEYNSILLYKDFAIVEKDRLYGIIDFNGKQLIPFEYEKLVPFEEGKDNFEISLSDNPTFIVRENGGSVVIINQNNEQVCEQQFDDIFELGTGYYYARIDNKCCSIDRFGNIKIPLGKFNGINIFFKLDNGDCVALAQNQEFQEALINQDGEIIIPFEAGYQNNGFMYPRGNTLVMIKDEKMGVIDTDNNIIIPFEYEWLFHDGNNFNGALKDGYYGYIDNQGKPLNIEIL